MLNMAIILSLLFSVQSQAESKKASDSSREIYFHAGQAQGCMKSKDVEKCLDSIFGKGIGYEVVDGLELRSIRYLSLKGIDLTINKTLFQSVYSPEIRFYSDTPGYTVCGTNLPVKLDNVFVKGRSGCICGFEPDGEFKRQLGQRFSFIPPKTKIEVSEMSCSRGASFEGNGVKLLEKTIICGYKFSAGTEFSLSEGGFEFEASKDGEIKGRNGTIKVKKGLRYMSDSNLESPCRWEQVKEFDPADEPR